MSDESQHCAGDCQKCGAKLVGASHIASPTTGSASAFVCADGCMYWLPTDNEDAAEVARTRNEDREADELAERQAEIDEAREADKEKKAKS